MGVFAGLDWDTLALVVLVLAVVVLAVLALRTPAGQEMAAAAGMRVVKALLAWLEVWLTGRLNQSGRSLLGVRAVDVGRLARVRELRKLAGDL